MTRKVHGKRVPYWAGKRVTFGNNTTICSLFYSKMSVFLGKIHNWNSCLERVVIPCNNICKQTTYHQ